MIVVIEHFLERAAVDHGLIAFEAFALLSLERFDRHGTKLDPLHRSPRIEIALKNLDSVKTRPFKRGKETFFDGKVFDPEDPAAYLKSLSIKRVES